MRRLLFSLSCLLGMTVAEAQTTTTIGSGVNMVNSGVTYNIPFGFFVDNGSYTDTVSPGAINVTGGVTFSGSGITKSYNLNFLTSGTNDMTAAGVQVYGTATLNSGVSLNAGAANLYLRTDDFLNPLYRTASLVNNGLLTGTVNGLSLYLGGVDYRTATTSGACPFSPVLSLNISGTSMVYQWQKSPDNSTWTNATGTSTGATYTPTVTVTTYYRCALSTSNTSYTQNTPSVQLTPTGLPTVGINITTNPICPPVNTGWPHVAGGTTNLTGTGATTYTWAPSTGLSATSGTTVTVSNLSSTTIYTVTGTTSGCSSTAKKQVTVNTAPTTAISGGHLQGECYWYNPSIWNSNTLTATGATTYTWLPNINLSATTGASVTCHETLLPSYARTYTVTGTSNTCVSNDTVKVETVDLQAWANPDENTAMNYFPGQTISLQMVAENFFNFVTGYGFDSVTYTWNSTAGITGENSHWDTLNITPTAGIHGYITYTYTGTYLGCPVDTTVGDTVQFVPCAITGGGTIIAGGNTTLTQTGGDAYITNWDWEPPTGLNNNTSQSVIASPTVTTVYTLTLTDDFGTIVSDTVTVAVQAVSIAGGTSPICTGGAGTSLTASGETTYTWAPAAGLSATTGATVTANPTVTTTYTVTGTGATTGTATRQVTVNTSPSAFTNNLPLEVNTNLPLGESTGGGTWTSGSPGVATVGTTTGIVNGVTTGTSLVSYTITSTGCMATATVTVNATSSNIWYSVTTGGDASAPSNWWSINNNTGYQPTVYSNSGDTWVFQSTMTSTAALTFGGNVSIISGGHFTPLASSNTNVGGNFTQFIGGSFVPNTGTVTMNGLSKSITAASMTTATTNCFYNLSFNAGSATTYTINSNILLMNNFTNLTSNGTIALGSHTMTIGGSFANPGPAITGESTITFNGSSPVTASGNR